MVHLINVSKHYGQQVLYKDSSLQIRPGDRIGLVGPNGAGKTTLFRIVTKQESVDSGQVNIAEKVVIGYFSQSVGDMKGRSALEEVKAGAGRISRLAAEIAEMEKKLEES